MLRHGQVGYDMNMDIYLWRHTSGKCRDRFSALTFGIWPATEPRLDVLTHEAVGEVRAFQNII